VLETPYFRAYADSHDPVAQIKIAKDLGFHAVFDSYLMNRNPDEQSRIGEELARQGITMAGMIFAPDTMRKPLWSATNPKYLAALEQEIRQSIAAAKRCGARRMVALTARDRFKPFGEQLYAFAGNLRRFAPLFEEARIGPCIESACPELAPHILIQRLVDAYTLVEMANSAAVSLMFDIYHVAMVDGDVISNLRWAAGRIGAIQLSDTLRHEPGGGAFNIPNIVAAALEAGYTGYFELEHVFSTPGAPGLDLALHRLEAIDEAVTAALNHSPQS
jgi:hydroxypyruvate isomerase